jgi:hypothetical protein
VHRKDSPKRARQRRRIALPAISASPVRRRLALAAPGPEAYLFPTRTGVSLSVSNERVLRSFVEDNRAALAGLGIYADGYRTHLYRRTAATLVERVARITLASRLLGMPASRSPAPAMWSAPNMSIRSRPTSSTRCSGFEGSDLADTASLNTSRGLPQRGHQAQGAPVDGTHRRLLDNAGAESSRMGILTRRRAFASNRHAIKAGDSAELGEGSGKAGDRVRPGRQV